MAESPVYMIYIAAHSRIREVACAFASRLASIGVEVTSRWHEQAQVGENVGKQKRHGGTSVDDGGKRSEENLGLDELRKIAAMEIVDIRRSRAVVAFLTHGSREAISVAAMAIGMGIPVILVGHIESQTRFLAQENVWVVEFFGDAFDMIKKQFAEQDEAGETEEAGSEPPTP